MRNSRRKIMVVFGTRPEAIKLAPVIKRIEEYADKLNLVVCVTAQHRQMLDQILHVFDITPHYDLDIMEKDQSLFTIFSKMICSLKDVIAEAKPDMVLVQGDTSTTFIASLAAFYFKIPVAYVEAGLRTNDKYNPFPEEMNRRLASMIADLFFVPTPGAKQNMIREGFDSKNIFITGNTAIDALFMVKNTESDFLRNLKISQNRRIILVTAHRREKFGEPFKQLCYALRDIVKINEDVELIYPVHLNPNVQMVVKSILGGLNRIHLIEPLEYCSFVQFMRKSYLIITDSGGIQEEAPSLGKPVVVIRKVTERPEGVYAGVAQLAGEDRKLIVKIVCDILQDTKLYRKMSVVRNVYGDGKAAYRIVKLILHFFKLGNRPREFIFNVKSRR